MKHLVWIVAGAAALAACSEKPQTASARKVDDKPWELTQKGFVAGGFKPGDQGAWEAQLKARAQAQNEYNRTVPR
ncbi:MAG: hypothetical protein U1F56_17320 [Rubrivivax sp.]